jgi:hypothetical protein
VVSLNILKNIENIPRVTVKGLEYVGSQIQKHPLETAVVVGSVAALGIGAFFTAGADLAAAPEVIAGETTALGGEAAATIGDAAAVTATDAAGAVGADAAAAEGAAATDAATAGTESVARSAGGTFINGLAKGAATAVKYGLPLGAIGIGAEYLSAGIADVEQSLLSGTVPYQITPTQLFGGGSGITGQVGSNPQTSTPSSILSSPIVEILLIIFGGFVLYEVVKHR